MSEPSPPPPDDTCSEGVCTTSNTSDEWSKVLNSLWFNLAVGGCLFLAFGALRGLLPVYEARSKHPRATGPNSPSPPSSSSTSALLFPFSWVAEVLSVSDAHFFDCCGIDALYLDRSMRLGMKAFTGIIAIVFSIVLPINYSLSSGHLPESVSSDSIEGRLDRTTMAFVPMKSRVLWVHFLVMVAITAWVFFLLHEQYRLYLNECHSLLGGATVRRQVSREDRRRSSFEPGVITNESTFALAEHIAEEERRKHLPPPPKQRSKRHSRTASGMMDQDDSTNHKIDQQPHDDLVQGREHDTVRTTPPPGPDGFGGAEKEGNAADDIELGFTHSERAALIESSWAKEKTMLPQSHTFARNRDTDEQMCVKPQYYASLITNAKPSKLRTKLSMYTLRYVVPLAMRTKGLHRQRERSGQEIDPHNTRIDAKSKEEEIESLLQTLFPQTFVYLLPVIDHRSVERLRLKRHATLKKYERALERSEYLEGDDAIKAGSDAVQLHAELKGLSESIEHEQRRLLKAHGHPSVSNMDCENVTTTDDAAVGKSTDVSDTEDKDISKPTSYFALFTDQTSAAIASQSTLRPGSGESWSAQVCPALNDVHWPTLWVTQAESDVRKSIVSVAVVGVYIFPTGAFAAMLGALSNTLCDSDSPVQWPQYCNSSDFSFVAMRRLLEVYLPAFLIVLWNGVAVPRLFYLASLARRKSVTLSSVDESVYKNFYVHGVVNTLIGAFLSGSVVNGILPIIRNPENILTFLGRSFVSSSNFFIDLLSVQAFIVQPFKAFFPHAGVLWFLCRCCGQRKGCCGWSPHDRLDSWEPKSYRFGAFYGLLSLIMLLGFAFSIVTPLISLFAFSAIALGWLVFRYQALNSTGSLRYSSYDLPHPCAPE